MSCERGHLELRRIAPTGASSASVAARELCTVLQARPASRVRARDRAPYPLFYPPPPPVDQVGVEERAAALAKRSLKKEPKVAGLKLAVR